ncbi:MAG: NADH-quinone oxidoreductase subunit J [Pseudomonadota bacterium]
MTIAFYLLAATTVLSGLFVISARNPVHSVLFLILAFISVAGLFVLLGAEYLAMLLIVVYVGAVAVLFLFVVMMLDVDFAELKSGFIQYVPLAGGVAAVAAAELIYVAIVWRSGEQALQSRAAQRDDALSNVENLGNVLYTFPGASFETGYGHYFQIAGLILLVAMIGAIVLTLRTREGVKKQDPGAQASRRREDAVEIRKVRTGQGI